MGTDGNHIFKNDNNHEITVYSSDILTELFNNDDYNNTYIIQENITQEQKKTELTQKLLVPEKGYGMMMLGDDDKRGGAKQKSKKRSKKSRKTKRRRYTRR
jgi:hypothetical protein